MTLFQGSGVDPRDAHAALADVLRWYGAIGDAAVGNTPGFGVRKGSLAVALAEIVQLAAEQRAALQIAGVLHAAGAIGSPAYRKGEMLTDRIAHQERWDVPARGARLCASIPALPPQVADMVRWQSECWDGTGYPDQLRWHGIPVEAQTLALADFYLHASDPEEALGAIGMQSGRAFGPDYTRAFTMWFHRSSGEVTECPFPADALVAPVAPDDVFDALADKIDDHNGVPGRWRRVAALASGAARVLDTAPPAQSTLAIACRIFGAGEVAKGAAEDDQFDPLARLGIDARAGNAAAAAALAEPFAVLRTAGTIIATRSEWYDGTGKPSGLRHADIPREAAILAASIAYQRLDRGERLEDAAGTQFDPLVVRAVLESAKARA